MTLSPKISAHNFYAFLWHAGFLALAQNFMDVDTIIPAMVIESGGGALHIGIMTAIMLGGSSFSQLLFAPYVSNKAFKKKFLLLGINVRVLSLFALGFILFYLRGNPSNNILWFIFLFITSFSLAGAFTNISYTDILGKSVDEKKRKTFFSAKQLIAGGVVLVSAVLAKQVLTAFVYPVNFAAMFFIGATLLFIASGGFWKIREVEPSALKINSIRTFLRLLRSELSANPKLIYFLGFINTQGLMISFLPFVMLYAKETLNTQSNDTGNFLIFKVIGVVSVSLLVYLASKRIKYNPILYLNALLSIMLIISTLLIRNEYTLRYIFIAGGVIFSLYTISMNGILLEISSREKRAVYTGFAGAGNILPALFPLAGGLAIEKFGFQPFFLLLMAIVSASIFFIRKIDCHK
ncbi:MAG: MFS transporter [Bacteroides sp.]|jgi:MFS family permease|nr:MFS transporter [Bacteroides sp.]